MRIIPALNVQTSEEAFDAMHRVGQFSHYAHLDVADGTFTPNTTWGAPYDIKKLLEDHTVPVYDFEIHLMVKHPEEVIDAWVQAGVKRIIVHAETLKQADYVFDACTREGVECMVSITLETDVNTLFLYEHKTTFFQLLAVSPGLDGQLFDKTIAKKIKTLRARMPNVTIEIDGGMTPETVRLCKDAGANEFVSASYILQSDDPRRAYTELCSALL